MKENKPKILVIFYSMYGHIFKMANAVAEGIREAGGEPILKQVAELIPQESWNEDRKAKELMKSIPIADPRKDLKRIDGITVGTPTRFGNMCSQMRNFWDQTTSEWMNGTHRKTCNSLHIHSHTTRRTGNYHHHNTYYAFTPRLRYSRSSIFFQRANDD